MSQMSFCPSPVQPDIICFHPCFGTPFNLPESVPLRSVKNKCVKHPYQNEFKFISSALKWNILDIILPKINKCFVSKSPKLPMKLTVILLIAGSYTTFTSKIIFSASPKIRSVQLLYFPLPTAFIFMTHIFRQIKLL